MLSRQEELDIERATTGRGVQTRGTSPLEKLAEAERARTAAFEEIAVQFNRNRREGFGMKIEALGNGAGILLVSDNAGDGAPTFEVRAVHGPWLRDQLARIFPV